MKLEIDFHVYMHEGEKASQLLPLLQQLTHKVNFAMATLDDLVSKVQALTTVDESVVALLTDLKTKLDAAIASGDPAKLQQLSDALDAQTQKLSDAVTANTPTP